MVPLIFRVRVWWWRLFTVAGFVALFATPAEATGVEPAIIMVVLVAAQAAATAAGAVMQSQAQKKQSEFQAKMADYQAGEAASAAARAKQQSEEFASYQEDEANRIRAQAELEAHAAEIAGQAAEATAAEEAHRKIARQSALIGASGIQLEGSPLEALMSGHAQAELEVERIRYGSSLEAYGARQRGWAGGREADVTAALTRQSGIEQALQYQRQSFVLSGQAKQSRAAARNYEMQGYIGAGAALLAGAGRIYGGMNPTPPASPRDPWAADRQLNEYNFNPYSTTRNPYSGTSYGYE
jgi:hypothetical protein